MVQTDIQEPVEVLEQRAPKGKGAQIVAEAAADSGLSEPEAIQANGHAPESVPGIYLVRVPKPPIDETVLKATQAEFQAHVDKLKKFNTVLSKKREEIRELRKQMGEARSLKETAEPEYQEKLTRIKQLKDLRETYLNRIKEIKGNLQGLECKSEEELDAKIRELENKISHEGMSLREEKQAVQQISKLVSQRPRIKEYDLHKSSLVELEAEAQKIKSIIADMDTEFNVIKTERNAASGIKKDIYGKLDKANIELKELEAEHNDAVKAKNDALEQLQKIRADMDASLAEYRENRKLSLEVRDLVAAGRVDEARERASSQVAELVAKISADSAYRKEYQQLWAQQRRFAVSDLLPESSVQAQQAAATKPGAKGAPAKGGKAVPGAKAPPPKPNGKEKAASIIESLMAQASKEVEALQSRRAAQQAADEGDDEEVEVAPKAAKAPKAEPSTSMSSTVTPIPGRLVTDPAAAAASAFNFKVELPKVDELDYTPLPLPRSSDEEQSPETKRATLLEEQRVKAAEAEERKKRRAEQAERRRAQAAETAKRLEQERKERDAAARAAAAQAKAAAARAPADDSANDSPATAAAKAEAVANKPSIPTNFEKRQSLAAAKRPKSKAPAPLRTATKVWQQYQAPLIFAAVMALVIIIAVMYSLS